MKQRTLAILVFVIGFLLYMRADEKMTYRTVDSASYKLYTEQKWDSLSIIGKLALKDGIDYYYLRMRLGAADFEREKYISAQGHFNKALLYDEYSYPAKSLQYYSVLYSGKKTMAYRYSRNFTVNQKERLGLKIKTVENLGLFGGYSFNDNYTKNGSINLLNHVATYGEQLLMGNMALGSLGINLNFSPTFSLSGNVTYERIEKRNRYQYLIDTYEKQKISIPPNGSWRNEFNAVSAENEQYFDSYINQVELYLNGKIQLDKGWSFNLFTNILFLNLTQYDAEFITVTTRDTLSYNANSNRFQFIDLTETDYRFNATDTSFVNFVLGFNLQKDFDFVKLDITGSFAKLYDSELFQLGVAATYYPLGSLKLYGTTGVIGFYQPEANFASDEGRLIFNQTIGVQMSKKIWLEAEFYSGDLNNANIKQGAIVYNLPDKINYTLGVNLHIFVNQHLSLHLMYDYYNKSGAYYNNGGAEGEYIKYSTNYQTHNILGGLKWTF